MLNKPKNTQNNLHNTQQPKAEGKDNNKSEIPGNHEQRAGDT